MVGIGLVRRLIRKVIIPLKIRIFDRDCVGNYLCPICSQKIRYYLPIPNHLLIQWSKHKATTSVFDLETFNIRTYRCPRCSATDRERLIGLYLNQLKSERRTIGRILDIGPKRRQIKALKSMFGDDYRSADLTSLAVDDRVDICDMGIYQDSTFDVIICCHVLEHIEEDTLAVKEFHRILSTNGIVLCLVPLNVSLENDIVMPTTATVEERWKYCLDGDHVRLYSRVGLENLFAREAFTVQYVKKDWFSDFAFKAAGLAEDSCLYVFRK